MQNIGVLICAYQPKPILLELISALLGFGCSSVVVVDDGSDKAYSSTFSEAERSPQVKVLRHVRNQGKGSALKTGFSYFTTQKNISHVITMDADGQHLAEDVLRLAATIHEQPDCYILGARSLSAMPLRSRLGNFGARMGVRLFTRRQIADTQTGMRGIPAGLLSGFSQLPGTGFEYEFRQLLTAIRSEIPILEMPIATVYNRGTGSHFQGVQDSLRILGALIN